MVFRKTAERHRRFDKGVETVERLGAKGAGGRSWTQNVRPIKTKSGQYARRKGSKYE